MENNQEIVNISPIGKGKRILLFLADFFINFLICFLIFNVAVMPVSDAITDSRSRQEISDAAAYKQFSILYNNKVLHYESEDDKYYYVANVESTMFIYLSYYSFENTDIKEDHPLYGHKEENEVLKHFYYDIRNNKDAYISILQEFNEKHPYFEINGYDIALKNEIKSEIKLSFYYPDNLSEGGKEALNYLENFFLDAYALVFEDITKNDLTYNDESYVTNKAIVDKCEKEFKTQLVVSTLISYLVSTLICYLIIPVISKDNKTLGMMMMRIQRIGTNNLFLLNKGEAILSSVYYLVFNISIPFFMPMTRVTFTYLFNIPLLTTLLFIGLLISLASMIVILFSSFNRSITDYLSRSVAIKNDDLDAIYRSKGYDI